MADPIDVFISHAPRDEALRGELEAHLASLRKSGEIRAFDASQARRGRGLPLLRDGVHPRR